MKRVRLHFFSPVVDHRVARSIVGESYTTRATGYSIRVEGEEADGPIVVFSESYIGPVLMGAIGKVRNHVRSRVKAGLVRWCEKKPVYTAAGRPLVGPSAADPARCCEIDLAAAYLTAARDIGAIEPGIYRWILRKFGKESRLKIIGSLGTKHTVRHWRRGAEIGSVSITPYDPDLRRVWDSIVSYTDKIMAHLQSAAGRDFLYRWADAIFVRPRARARVAERARRLGFGVKAPTKIYTLARAKDDPNRIDCSDGRPFFTHAMRAAEMIRRVF